jgi:hypothetical protein
MAHFAKLDENNVVVEVRAVGNDIPTSNGPLGENDMHPDGETYCSQTFGGIWKQTSYHNNFRNKFAGIGNIYNEDLDIFTCSQPHPDFLLTAEGNWEAPVKFPNNLVFDTTGPIDDNDPPTIGPIKIIIQSINWNTNTQAWEGVDNNNTKRTWNPNTTSWS